MMISYVYTDILIICTQFAMPETLLGFFPDVGSSHFMSRLPGSLGLYLGLIGSKLRAEDLMYAGE